MSNTISLLEILGRGLVPELSDSRAEQYMTDIRGGYATPTGIYREPPATIPVAKSQDAPYPQLFQGHDSIILAEATSIYRLSYSSSWSATAFTPIDTDTYGAELITNGDFASGATGWTGIGFGGWAVSSEQLVHTKGATSGVLQSSTFTAGNIYRVAITVADTRSTDSSSYIRINLGGNQTDYIYEEGEQIFFLAAGSDHSYFSIAAQSDFSGSIDNVSLKAVQTYAITDSGKPWTFGYYGDAFALSNGSSFLYYHPDFGLLGSDSAPEFCCSSASRLILGGLSAFPSNAYLTKVNTLDNWYSGSVTRTGADSVYWSNIGWDDILYFFLPELLSNKAAVDIISRNESGYQSVSGDVMGVCPYKNGFMVGTTTKIYGMAQIEGFTGFSTNTILDTPLFLDNALCGNDKEAYFLDSEGALYQVNSEGLARLGYQDYLDDNTSMILQYLASEDLLYIIGNSKTYLLSRSGLSESYRNYTSILDSYYGPIGYYSAADTSYVLTTGTIAPGEGKAVTLRHIQIITPSSGTYTVAIQYRNDSYSTFSTKNISVSGGSTIFLAGVTAVEFRITVGCATSASRTVNNILLGFDDTSLRIGIGDY